MALHGASGRAGASRSFGCCAGARTPETMRRTRFAMANAPAVIADGLELCFPAWPTRRSDASPWVMSRAGHGAPAVRAVALFAVVPAAVALASLLALALLMALVLL